MNAAPHDSWEPATWLAREGVLLAAYAMHSADSAGRKYPEPEHPYRGPFQRDRDRIVHAAAFRRLSSKTQVFTGGLDDYHRTRLTHTLEVASVSRTIGRTLRLNEDLIEALALVHDLGHPPYGHAGEDVLDECLRGEGGFSHNRQGLRIVEEVEHRYPDFPGLNLSLEVLEGQTARTGTWSVNRRPLVEAQVVEAADSIAYDTHDADDALKLELLTLDELLTVPLWSEAKRRVDRHHAGLTESELKRAVLHELLDWQVSDVVERARRRLADPALSSVEAVRAAEPIITASPELAQQKLELEKFLRSRVYRHPQVLVLRARVQQQLREMFAGYLARPELLPPHFAARVARHGLRRTIGDYLAGMTDRYAEQEYERLFAQQGS